MKPKLVIAVTGLNNIDSPGPGIPVIRGLREATSFDVRIVGLAYENLEPGIYMRDQVDMVYQIPYPSVGHDTLMARLAYIQEQEGRIDVIIPNFDAELYSFMRLQPRLKEMGIAMLLPTIEQFEARVKGRLEEFGALYDINVPKGITVFNTNELQAALHTMKFPIMVKGKFYEAFQANTTEQAFQYFYKLSAKWGTPIILQQFVKGEEFNVTAIGDGKGNLIGAVPMRKTYITNLGKAWAGVTIKDDDLMDMTRRIVEQTHWGGGLELELIKENDTDKVYLIEINPRFPAWVYLAVGAGQNHPEALVNIALGKTVEPFDTYKVGTMFVRYSWDLIADMADFAAINTQGETGNQPNH